LQTIHQILKDHFSRYPAMQEQDLYKLLHQATLGSEHAVGDLDSARKWLERELLEIGAGSEEPIFDPISPDGEILRVHLRPYIRAGRDPRDLLAAFLRTAYVWNGSKATLRENGQLAAQLAEMEDWPLQKVEIEAFFAKMEALNFPAAHHSVIYAGLYRPAYRVVSTRFLEAV
jgi:hypothetical protein